MAASLRSTRPVAKAVLLNRVGRIGHRLSSTILMVKMSGGILFQRSGQISDRGWPRPFQPGWHRRSLGQASAGDRWFESNSLTGESGTNDCRVASATACRSGRCPAPGGSRRGKTFSVAGNLDQEVRPPRSCVQILGRSEGTCRVMGQQRRHLQGHPPVHTASPGHAVPAVVLRQRRQQPSDH
jgi:hypothetical protein